ARVRTLLGGIKSTDYPVDEAPTFEAGLRLAGAHRHAAILVGDRLEGAAGLDFIRAAHGGNVARAPLILLAGREADRAAARAAGADDCLEPEALAAATLEHVIRGAIERRRLLDALKDRDTHLNLVLGTANLGFWELNPQTADFYISPEFKRLLGHDDTGPVFATRAQWLEAVHPDDRGMFEHAGTRFPDETEGSAKVLFRMRDKAGAFRWLQGQITVVRGDDHRPQRVIGTVLDVTERVTVERRLREQATLLDGANDMIVVRDLTHRYLYCNQAAARHIGKTTDELLQGAVTDAMGVVPPQYYEAFREVLQRGEWRGELTYKRPDGSAFTVESHWSLVRDEAAQPKAVLAISTDVTERKHLEAQYLRAQRMESIGMLAGGIAHDLNNVLAPIVMAIQLLRMRHADASSQKLLATIEASAQRGADLVRQVLTFARGLEGQHLLVHPKLVVRDVEKLIKETFHKSIEVSSRIDPDIWPVPGDPTQLHQVLMNLCVNARDAMPHGGRITLTAANARIDEQYAAMIPQLRAGLYVVLEVQDTGTGMPPEVQRHLFEPFYTTKEPGKGTGLGLSTALTIVKNHDGAITCVSEAGQGTTFKIFLPASTETALARGTVPAATPPRGNGETILVVDDEASILSISRQALEAFGYEVLTASNGAEALALFAQQRARIAAVLTDMAMPVLDGAALIYALRRIDPGVKVIAASGLKGNAQSMEPFGLGTASFLSKPFTAETMLQAIHEALSGSRAPAVGRASGPAPAN
ncbi:MAG TPA: ATP-binding protein, partial [Opitutaceae bacterium]|nr:ATP-binding protein [Opitutaceae bacterium]